MFQKNSILTYKYMYIYFFMQNIYMKLDRNEKKSYKR